MRMKIHNQLPVLLDCLSRWEKRPSAKRFKAEYADVLRPVAGDFFDRFQSLIDSLNWEMYRNEALSIDPAREEKRLIDHIASVEELFGFELEGEILLLGAFTFMDGYARFDRGGHRVFLAVDESHGRGRYIDVLTTHELTHVARESRPEVWTGFGLDPKMSQAEFRENQPVIEHLMNEGFSCVVSEILVPGEPEHAYCYQTDESLRFIYKHGPALDRTIHQEIAKPAHKADYSSLYATDSYTPEMPRYAHYAWAWQWSKHVLYSHCGGDPKELVSRCSKEFIPDALAFSIGSE